MHRAFLSDLPPINETRPSGPPELCNLGQHFLLPTIDEVPDENSAFADWVSVSEAIVPKLPVVPVSGVSLTVSRAMSGSTPALAS